MPPVRASPAGQGGTVTLFAEHPNRERAPGFWSGAGLGDGHREGAAAWDLIQPPEGQGQPLKLRRCVGPQRAGHFGLRAHVDHTDAAKVPREIFRGDRARRGGNVPLPREFADDGSAKFARACLFTMSSGATSYPAAHFWSKAASISCRCMAGSPLPPRHVTVSGSHASQAAGFFTTDRTPEGPA
jgi:hypothetical protein